MENARGQNCIRLAFEQHSGHVLQTARAAAGHHRHAHGFANTPRDDQIESRFRPICINAVQHNFAGTEQYGTFGPFDGI